MEPLDTVGVHAFAQPAMALTVAVYTVVAQGEAFTHAPVVLERPAAGVHEMVLPGGAPDTQRQQLIWLVLQDLNPQVV